MIFSEMRRHRLRLTKTRRAVVEVFFGARAPLSAPQILLTLGRMSLVVNKTTVYRELERLEKIGIVRGVWFQDRKQYYELADRDHHHHFVCTLCDNITDIEINESGILAKAERIGRRLGFHITTHAVEFYGQCTACVSALSSRSPV